MSAKIKNSVSTSKRHGYAPTCSLSALSKLIIPAEKNLTENTISFKCQNLCSNVSGFLWKMSSVVELDDFLLCSCSSSCPSGWRGVAFWSRQVLHVPPVQAGQSLSHPDQAQTPAQNLLPLLSSPCFCSSLPGCCTRCCTRLFQGCWKAQQAWWKATVHEHESKSKRFGGTEKVKVEGTSWTKTKSFKLLAFWQKYLYC